MTTETITAATITDAQILALRDEAVAAGDRDMANLCDLALDPKSVTCGLSRAECAKAINAAAAMADDE